MSELPDPTFISRAFKTWEEAQAWTEKQTEKPPEDLICWWDEGNKFWQVTTQANFQSDAYWTGQVETLDELPGDE